MKRLLVVVSAVFAAVSVQADTFVWNANGSGGWGAKERWFQSDGTTAATRAPTSGDTCNIPAGVEADVDDDDQAAFQSIDGVWLVDAASRVILAATNDFTVGCTIDGKGGVVKRNANKVTVSGLGKIKKTNGQSDSVADCAPGKGWFIEEGWVVAPQGGKVASTDYYTLGYLTIAAKGTCQMSNGMTFVIPGCDCAGLITNAPPTTTWQGVWFGRRYSSDICKVSGRLGGTKWGVTTWGRACLTGAESTVAGANFGMSFHQATFNNGTLEIMKFGLKGQPSSIGLDMGLQMSYSGCMRYLGTGEITDKSFNYRAQRTYRNVVDGGAYGGLVFTSPWGQIQDNDCLYLGRLALTGSNSVPCVIAGGWNQNVSDANGYFSTYVVKQGKGAWRIGDSDKNTQRGVFEVQEGALQFDRIAMTNATCSLGLSTVLYRDVGDNEPEKTEYKTTGIPRLDKNKVAYSVLLGGTTTNVVFEYTGTNSSTTCSRKIALKGKGGRIRLSSDGEVRLFGGIYAEDTTDQTLVLDGEGAGAAEAGEIENGNARVSVVKDGSCTWTLRRNLTFGGSLDVRKGTLVVDAEGEPYNWYRFVVLTADKSYWGYANQLNLYDEGGKWCNANLSMRIPGWTDRTTYSYWNCRKVGDGIAVF